LFSPNKRCSSGDRCGDEVYWRAASQDLNRRTALTVALGIACLVLLLFPKPLWFYIIRYFASANDPARGAVFSANWRYPGFRTFTRVLTLV